MQSKYDLLINSEEAFPMRKLGKRSIAIVLGTGADDIKQLGIEVKDSFFHEVSYSARGRRQSRRVKLYDARVCDVPVYLLCRHSGSVYVPAYGIDHGSNMYALVDDSSGAGAKIILASSLVGGCRTTGWKIGDKVAVRDCVDAHPDTRYFRGNQPYVHGHSLFDPIVTGTVLAKAGELGINVRDGGIYFTGPYTTSSRFETPAEMSHLLLPAYNASALLKITKDKKTQSRLERSLSAYPNLVGMTLGREAGLVRTLSTRRKDGYRTRFAGLAVISDFPEDEMTEHEKNAAVAIEHLPVVMKIFAAAVPELSKALQDGKI
jgi:purine nucleoside phosphorylase